MKVFETKIDKEDLPEINDVLLSGNMGFGPNVGEAERIFNQFSGKKHNVATNSASAAAYIIFAYLRQMFGRCNVYTPSIGFTSPVWAAKKHGHDIIWVDVDDNLLFDVEDYKKKKKDGFRYSVIMPILYGGVSTIPGFDTIGKPDEIIVVDSAHCVTPTIDADHLFFSFHPYKPLACSDGGMISTEDEHLVDYSRLYRNFARRETHQGYDIVGDGFKFYMNNLNATILLTQIPKYDILKNERKRNYERLKEELSPYGRMLPHDEHSSYYFGTMIVDEEHLNEMKERYPTSKHYPMLHQTSYYCGNLSGALLSNTERLHPYIINIPLYE